MMSPKANKKKISRDMMLQEKKEWGFIRCASRSAGKIKYPFDPLRWILRLRGIPPFQRICYVIPLGATTIFEPSVFTGGLSGH